MRHMKSWAIALGAVVLLSLAAGIAWAATSDEQPGEVIHGCYQLKNDLTAPKGNVRIINPAVEECDLTKETPISWNEKGPKGDTGEAGATGPKGDKGDPGDALATLNALDGIPCTRSGQTGEVSLSYSSDGVGVLTCVLPPSAEPVLVSLEAHVVWLEADAAWQVVGTVTIDRPAPPGGTRVQLQFDPPPGVQDAEIPEGETSASFRSWRISFCATSGVGVEASLGDVYLHTTASCP